MPELPELEALAEALDPLVRRSAIAGVPVLHFAVSKTYDPPWTSLEGQRFTAAKRRAKRLLFPLDGGATLMIHLMTNGRMAFVEPGQKRPQNPVLAVAFEDGSELVVSERATRKAVRVGLYSDEQIAAELAGLGPEPLEEGFDRVALEEALKRGGQLHGLLRDQRAIAGIGRAYADEILHAAMLSPFAMADRLSEEEVDRLEVAIQETLKTGLERFRKNGPKMAVKKPVAVYEVHHHAGDPCPRCREELKFVDFSDHQVVYCPNCQTGGKIYADRRRSKLLK
jgi:formamidopyrimidine-DNA glycosylase